MAGIRSSFMYLKILLQIRYLFLLIFLLSVAYFFASVSMSLYESKIDGSNSNLKSNIRYKNASIGVMGDKDNRFSVTLSEFELGGAMYEFYNWRTQKHSEMYQYEFSPDCFNGTRISELYSDTTDNSVYSFVIRNKADIYIQKFFVEKGGIVRTDPKFVIRHPVFNELKDSSLIVNGEEFYGFKLLNESEKDSIVIKNYCGGWKIFLKQNLFEKIKGYPLSPEDFNDTFTKITDEVGRHANVALRTQDIVKIRMFFERRRNYQSLFKIKEFEEVKNFLSAKILGRLDTNGDGFEELIIQTNGDRYIDEIIFSYDEKNSRILWKREYALGLFDWLISDIDNDGEKEIALSIGAPCCQPSIDYYDKIDTGGITFFPRFEILDKNGKIKILNGKAAKYNLEPKGGFYSARIAHIPEKKKIITGLFSVADYSEKKLLSFDTERNCMDSLRISYNNIYHLSCTGGEVQIVNKHENYTELIILNSDLSVKSRRKTEDVINPFDIRIGKDNNSSYFIEHNFFRIRNKDFDVLYSKKIIVNKFVNLGGSNLLLLVSDVTDSGSRYMTQMLIHFEKKHIFRKSAFILLGAELLIIFLYIMIRSTFFVPIASAQKNYITIFSVPGLIHVIKTYGNKNVFGFSRKITFDTKKVFWIIKKIDPAAKLISSKSFIAYTYKVYEVSSPDEMLAIQIIAHDIKNNIAGIKFITDRMLKGSENNKELDDIIKTALINATKLSSFTNLSKINHSDIDLIKMINRLVREYSLNNCGIKFVKNYESNKLIVILDEKKLETVLRNLIQNSIDAINETLDLSGSEIEENKKAVNIVLRSEKGRDILTITNYTDRTPDLIPKIRLGFTTKKTGTGTGLYIVRKIVESMNGSVEYDIKENRFSVILKFNV